MSAWIEIADLLDRTFSLYSAGQTIGADGGVSVAPVLKVAAVPASIQPLTGNEEMMFGKTLQDATHQFICLTLLDVKNGDIIIDDFSIKYRVLYFET